MPCQCRNSSSEKVCRWSLRQCARRSEKLNSASAAAGLSLPSETQRVSPPIHFLSPSSKLHGQRNLASLDRQKSRGRLRSDCVPAKNRSRLADNRLRVLTC